MALQHCIIQDCPSEQAVKFIGNCRMCNKHHVIKVTEDEMQTYNNGAMIQHAFPNMHENDREFLISSICGSCFDNMFTGDE